jgi:phosphate transport system protein
MHTQLEDELETLKEQILLMGGKVEEAIRHSMKSLTDRDSKLAEQVIQRDRKIDDLQIEVDEHCHKMLALYQPTAGDMRFITSTMKINSDLERMGDLAVNIAERAITLNEEEPLKPYIDLPRMSEVARDMVHQALDSLVSGNVGAAKRVCERDDEVDHLNDQIFRELISYMLEDRENITRSMELILVARHLERIADHATNVAEDVIYLVEGRDIRHHRG